MRLTRRDVLRASLLAVGARAEANRPLGRVLFAHSDGQGLPAFEAAIWEGMRAAEDAKLLLKK